MPPVLAAAIIAAFIAGLFAWEASKKEPHSSALWIPVAWLAITGSRFIGQWLTLGELNVDNMTEGSTVDAAFFLACIIASIIVLIHRRVGLGETLRNNRLMVAFFLFCLLSLLWSDFQFIALKRWIKVLGHPLVALVILTDPDPKKALVTVMKRCAYLMLPVSVLFIKYYPEYGRGFDPFTGQGYNAGVGLNKNYLGCFSMTFGVFFLWHLLNVRKLDDARLRRIETLISCVFIGMAVWLLKIADSATSLGGFVVGAATILALGRPWVDKRYIGTYVVIIVLACAIIEVTFDAYATILRLLNRDPTLTDRTEIWADVLAIQPNALIGAGFESFWLGDRLDVIWRKWWWHPNQAHNGYIETYLNLGFIGLFLLGALLLSTFRRITRSLSIDFEMGRLSLAFLFIMILYNYTEAAFKGVHFMWTIFHLIAVNYPLRSERKEAKRTALDKATGAERPRGHTLRTGRVWFR